MPTYSASTAAGLEDLLTNTVTDGDIIELASGNYTELDLDNYVFTDFVTITSADGNYGAKVGHLDIFNCEYLKFTKIDFLKTAATTNSLDRIVHLKSYDNITFDDVKIRCSNASNVGYVGIYKDANVVGTNLIVQNSLIENCDGISLYTGSGTTSDVTISGNEYNDIHGDANKFSNVTDLIFEENYIHDFRQRGTVHNDVIQLEGPGCARWIIRKNRFLVGALEASTPDIQVFYCQQYPMDDLLIEDNIIYTHHSNAIKVNLSSTNVIVRRNTVIFDPTDTSQTQAIIISPGTKSDNIWCSAGPGSISGSNVILNCDNPGDPYYYGDLITNPLGGAGTTLADLVSVEGTAAEGKGAAAYLATLLGAESAPVITGSPTISGLETVGQTLTASRASVAASPSSTVTWQWYNSVSGAISGATSSTYVIDATDEGDTLFVIQTESNGISPDDTAQSANTGTIGAAVSNPTLSSLAPADNATGVALNTTLQVTLNKNIQFGSSGTVKLYNLTTGVGPVVDPNSQVGQWTVAADAGGAMTISSATLTVTRAGLLREGHNYCVTVSAGTLESTDGGTFAGISGATAWNFTATGASTPTTGVRVGNGLLSVAGKIILVG